MCLAIPAQITEIDGARGKVTLAGNVREADFSLIDEPAVGDWVLVHAGFAIELSLIHIFEPTRPY